MRFRHFVEWIKAWNASRYFACEIFLLNRSGLSFLIFINSRDKSPPRILNTPTSNDTTKQETYFWYHIWQSVCQCTANAIPEWLTIPDFFDSRLASVFSKLSAICRIFVKLLNAVDCDHNKHRSRERHSEVKRDRRGTTDGDNYTEGGFWGCWADAERRVWNFTGEPERTDVVGYQRAMVSVQFDTLAKRRIT